MFIARIQSLLRCFSMAWALCIAAPVLAQVNLVVNTGTAIAPTGSGQFDANDLPGNDSRGDNLVVRTQDTITYEAQYSVVSGPDTNIVINLTLPTCDDPLNAAQAGCAPGKKLAIWQNVPGTCGVGSSISSNGLTLTCVAPPCDQASCVFSILPIARILGSSPNGAKLSTPVGSITSANFPAAVPRVDAAAGPVVISAKPQLDLGKVTGGSAGQAQFAYGADGVTPGYLITYPVAIFQTKEFGTEAVQGALTVVDTLSSITVSGGTGPQNAALQSLIANYGVIFNGNGTWPAANSGTSGGCRGVFGNSGVSGFDSYSAASGNINSPQGSFTNNVGQFQQGVKSNTTCQPNQSGPGQPVNIVLNNDEGFAPTAKLITGGIYGGPSADVGTYQTFPSSAGTQYFSFAVTERFITSDRFGIWVPASVGATSIPIGVPFTISNQYPALSGTSISGQAFTETNLANNQGSAVLVRLASGGGNKYWGNCGTSPNCASVNISGDHTLDGKIVPGNAAYASSYIYNTGSEPLTGVVMCEKIDNTKFVYSSFNNAISVYSYSRGRGLIPGVEFVAEVGVGGDDGSALPYFTESGYAAATCSDNAAQQWIPVTYPLNTANLMAAVTAAGYPNTSPYPQTHDKITRIRVKYLQPQLPGGYAIDDVYWGDMTALAAPTLGPNAGVVWPVGTKLNNRATYTFDQQSVNCPGNANNGT